MVLRRFKLWAVVTCSAIMYGCASSGLVETTPKAGSKAAVLNQLPPQTLPQGACALFVWTADAKKRFILFSQSRSKSAIWNNGQEDVTLNVSQTGGSAAYQQYPQQSLRSASGLTLDLNLSGFEAMDTGARFQSGLLTISEDGDWERIIPVIGLATCQD